MAGAKRRQKQRQVAALPLRLGPSGEVEAMLVTSRRTRRWVLPKGNLMKGVSDAEAAAIEAAEEAGVYGRVRKSAAGSYDYWKRRALAFELCRVDVYVLAVTHEADEWKEKDERERAWIPLRLTPRLVLEPALQSILRGLAGEPSVARLLGAGDRAERRSSGGSVESVRAA